MSDINQLSDQSETIKKELGAMVNGLSFLSETDAPIEIVSFDNTAAGEIEAKLKADAGEPNVSQIDFKEFFAMYGSEKDWQSQVQRNFAQKFGAALQLLENKTQKVMVYRLGGVRADLYIIGELPSKEWLGMKTQIVET